MSAMAHRSDQQRPGVLMRCLLGGTLVAAIAGACTDGQPEDPEPNPRPVALEVEIVSGPTSSTRPKERRSRRASVTCCRRTSSWGSWATIRGTTSSARSTRSPAGRRGRRRRTSTCSPEPGSPTPQACHQALRAHLLPGRRPGRGGCHRQRVVRVRGHQQGRPAAAVQPRGQAHARPAGRELGRLRLRRDAAQRGPTVRARRMHSQWCCPSRRWACRTR